MATYEGRWDCRICGTVGNLGRDKVCPHCGAPRGNVKFYLPEGESPVSQPDMLRDAQAGPDWFCSACGASNSGYRVNCKQCGAPKDASVQVHATHSYSLADTPRSGDRDVQVDHDWECSVCGGVNSQNLNTCAKCGAPRGTKPHSDDTAPTPEPEWKCANCGAHNPESRQTCEQCGVKRGESGWQKYNRESSGTQPVSETPQIVQEIQNRIPTELPPWAKYAGIALAVVLVLCGIWFLFFRTEQHVLTVTGFSWERTVNIEKYTTVTESGWSVPAGGRTISSREEIDRYDKVFDHYETETYNDPVTVNDPDTEYVCGKTDLGNGYFEDKYCEKHNSHIEYVPKTRQVAKYRDVPHYATKYTYEIDKWVFSRTSRASGQDHNARWPLSDLAGNERQNGSTETYTVNLKDEKGKTYTYGCNNETWFAFRINGQYVATINTVGMITDLKESK